MDVLIVTIGSLGDMLPFVGLAAELKRRGHNVTLGGNAYFRDLVEQEQLDFVEIVGADEYRREVVERKDWSPLAAVKFAIRRCVEKLDPVEKLVSERVRNNPDTVVLAQLWMLGARIARERHAFRLLTCHMTPMWLLPSQAATKSLPWGDRLHVGIVNSLTDRFLGSRVNEHRRSLGLPPVQRLLQEWWHGPEGVCAFFPDWFGTMPRHELPQFHHLGYPRFDQYGNFEQQEELENFLSQGDPPIVFSRPSYIDRGSRYRDICVETLERLNCRGIFLSQSPGTRPEPADRIRDFGYVQLSQLLPRCKAHVHHGGLGTLAQALAAGCPQVIIPAVSDQPDNGKRLTEIGVGRSFPPKKLSVPRLETTFRELFESTTVRTACAEASRKVLAESPFETGADLLEAVASRPLSRND